MDLIEFLNDLLDAVTQDLEDLRMRKDAISQELEETIARKEAQEKPDKTTSLDFDTYLHCLMAELSRERNAEPKNVEPKPAKTTLLDIDKELDYPTPNEKPCNGGRYFLIVKNRDGSYYVAINGCDYTKQYYKAELWESLTADSVRGLEADGIRFIDNTLGC